MVRGNKCLSIFLFTSMLVMLFVAIVIPVIVRKNVSSGVLDKVTLIRENADTWATVPGSRKIDNTKSFILYNLTSDASTIFNGTMNFEEIVLDPYRINYSFEDLNYEPNTNESISYYKKFQHTYLGDEAKLHDNLLRSFDLGGFKTANLMASLKPSQIFVMTMSRLVNAFNNDILYTLWAQAAYEVLFKHKDVVNSTVFMYQNTLTPEQAQALWNDPDYGWGQVSTFKVWFSLGTDLYMSGGQSPNYAVPNNDTLVNTLMYRFGLTYDQMNALLGGQSMIAKVVHAVQWTYRGLMTCENQFPCTNNQLFYYQYFQNSLTQNPFPGLQAYDSLQGLNSTFAFPPEASNVDPTVASSFDISTVTSLFTPGTPNTLLSFRNVDFLLSNSSTLDDIAARFSLSSNDQAQFLIDYVNYIIKNTYLGDFNEANQNLKAATDLVGKTFNDVFNTIRPLMSFNLTAIGTYNLTISKNFNCSYFVSSALNDNTLVEPICDNPQLTLDSAIGQSLWIEALLEGPAGNAWSFIKQTLNTTDDNIQALVSSVSEFGKIVQEVTSAISQAVGCSSSICRANELLFPQWSANAIVPKLPTDYFFDPALQSLADIFPNTFSIIPEFSVYASQVANKTVIYPQDKAETILSYGQGSILNKFEMYYLGFYGRQGAFDQLADRFGISNETVILLYNYTNHVYVQGVLSPKDGDYTRVSSIYEFLWGWQAESIINLSQDDPFEGGQPYDAFVSLAGPKDNADTYHDGKPNLINSGSSDISLVRKTTAYKGNTTLAISKQLYDGQLNYSEWYLPWGQQITIDGTDGVGFKPYLTSGEVLTIFEPDFMRNLAYSMRGNKQIGSESFDLYNYTLDDDELGLSSKYHIYTPGFINLTQVRNIPMVASYPYFLGCPEETYDKVLINGTKVSEFQDGVIPGNFLVEKLTGFTLNYTKNYQYSLEYQNPFYPELGKYTVPLITIQESFTTPSAQMDSDLKDFYHSLETAYFVQIIGFIFAGLLFWAWLFYFIIVRKKGANLDKSDLERSGYKSKLSEYQSKLIHSAMIEEANENEENDDMPQSRLSTKGLK